MSRLGRDLARRSAGLLLALPLMTAGCVPQLPGIVEPAGFFIINDTTEPVHVFYLKDGVLGRVGRIAVDDIEVFSLDLFDPGNDENCTTGTVIVRRLDGSDVARIPPPVCDYEKIQLSAWSRR